MFSLRRFFGAVLLELLVCLVLKDFFDFALFVAFCVDIGPSIDLIMWRTLLLLLLNLY